VPRRASVDLPILSYASMQPESSRGALVGARSGASFRCSRCGLENARGILVAVRVRLCFGRSDVLRRRAAW